MIRQARREPESEHEPGQAGATAVRREAPPPAANAVAGLGDDDEEGAGVPEPREGEEIKKVVCSSFEEAAEQVEDAGGAPIGWFHLHIDQRATPRRVDRIYRPGAIRRFVAALGRREGGRRIRNLIFDFVDFGRLPGEDSVRLFGEALPAHPTLEAIEFRRCGLPAPLLTIFARSVPAAPTAAPLRALEFHDCPFGRAHAEAVAEMVRRNAPLAALKTCGLDPGMDAGSCELICQAAARSASMRHLWLEATEVFAGTLEAVAAASSPLRELFMLVVAPLPSGTAARVATQLRTNTTMTSLGLYCKEAELGGAIVELLDAHNFTLEEVDVSPCSATEESRINELLDRNQEFQTALKRLEPRGHRREGNLMALAERRGGGGGHGPDSTSASGRKKRARATGT